MTVLDTTAGLDTAAGRSAPTANPQLLTLVGNTPLARITTALPHRHGGFLAKLECLSAGGMKARAAVSMLRAARASGRLRPGAPVVESTSGTLGLGLAFAGQALGHPVVLVVDDELEPAMRTLLRAHGARLEVVARPHAEGGWQRARLDRLRQVLHELPGAFWPDQYNNPANPAGYAELARELVEQAERVDILVCSVGTGGHSAGVITELRRFWPGVRLVGVDTVGSTIFGQPARARVMRGLGSSIHPRNVAYGEFDEVHWLGPVEVVHACRRLATDGFITGGWSTGAAAVVSAWLARLEPGATVVTIFPDGPHRYLGTIFDDAYCAQRGLFAPPAPFPIEIARPDAIEVSAWARCRTVTDPLAAAELVPA